MLIPTLSALLQRDLRSLRREVESYSDERDLWRVVPGIANSAGNLTLHLAGNLQHFIGARLGGSSYVRDRDSEFSQRDLPRSRLLQEVEAAREAVVAGLGRLQPDALSKAFPDPVGGVTLQTDEFLLHLSTHLAFHLGQLDYHRRIVTGVRGSIGALGVAELATAKRVAA